MLWRIFSSHLLIYIIRSRKNENNENEYTTDVPVLCKKKKFFSETSYLLYIIPSSKRDFELGGWKWIKNALLVNFRNVNFA
jgi:hypothetical protein